MSSPPRVHKHERVPPSSSPSSLSLTMATPRSTIKRPEPECRPPWRAPSRALSWLASEPRPPARPPSRSPSRPASCRCRPPSVTKNLPEDIIFQLLLRLPVKTLMRFKCVSKRWWSLISDPGFAKWHLQMLKARDVISSQRILKTYPIETMDYKALDYDSTMIKFRKPRIDDSTWTPLLVGSCDGLVCLDVIGGFIIYNPTTEEFRKIPTPDLYLDGKFFKGFGYDLASDDYKVVVEGTSGDSKVAVGEGSKICQVAIFSLKSGFWRRIQVQQESCCLADDQKGVYWNGALHWCGIGKGRNERVIMSFDLSEEMFHQMLSVPEWSGQILFLGLKIHGANLLMYTSNDHRFMAWITNEFGRGVSWTKLFSFSSEAIPGIYLQIPVAFTRSGKIVFQADFDIIVFNPEDNTYSESPIERDKLGIYAEDKLAIYVETLISPYLGCEPSRI